MKKIKQILAWIGIIFLVGIYAAAFICAFMKSELAETLFRAAIGSTIIIPVFLYLILMVAKTLRPAKSAVIDAVIFDMGKVLMDYPWEERTDRFSFSPDCDRYIREVVNPSPLWNEFDLGIRPFEEIVKEFTDQKPEYAAEIREFIETVGDCISPFWYAEELVKGLRRKGYKVYFLSNWSRENHDELAAKGLFDFVKFMNGGIWSYEVHVIKPDPEIYRLLTEKFSLNPARCVFVDDREENIAAAKKAGFASILFTDYNSMIEKLESVGVYI